MITITRNELKRIWEGLRRVIARRTVIPVLNHVLVTSTGGRTTVEATDLDQCLVADVKASTTGDCRFLLPVEELKNLASGRGDEQVELGPLDDSRLTVLTPINGQQVGRTVATVPVNEWPGPFGDIATQPVKVGTLIAAYRKAATAASRDQSRYVLTGVYLDPEAKAVVGTDGRRLLRVGLGEFVLPRDAILPLTKALDSDLLEHEDGALGIACENERDNPTVRLVAGGWDYRVKSIEAKYPDYRQVIPDLKALPGSISIAAADLATVKAACQQFPNGHEHGITLYADAAVVALLHVTGTGAGPEIVHVVLANSTAQVASPLVLCLNREFLWDGLNAGFTTIHVNQTTTPLRFSGEADGTYVVMPLRDYAVEPIIEYVNTRIKPGLTVTVPVAIVPPAVNPTPEVKENSPVSNETPIATPPTEVPGTPAEASATPTLKLVGAADPMTELLGAIDTARDKLSEAAQALKTLKTTAREVERQHRAEQREFAGISDVVAKLKKLAA